jgi:predicted XRE-type DNA-binding protein
MVTKGKIDASRSVLDDLGFNPETTAELKLKVELHQGILALIKKHDYSARDLEGILDVQQPRVSELMRGKLSTLSIRKLLGYLHLLNGEAEIRVRERKTAA